MSRNGSAILSEDCRYRYRLERHGLAGAGAIAWIMVNPSMADADADDATIRKVIGFSERAGAGWVIVGNLFAWRATDIKELRALTRPVAQGYDNDEHLAAIMQAAPLVIAAWGPTAKLAPHHRHRWRVVHRMAAERQIALHCLGVCNDGQPRHPIMVSYDTPITPWRAPL